MTVAAVPWREVFASALRGDPCVVHGLRGRPFSLPVEAWTEDATSSDDLVLRQCSQPTLDVGCGPGRMSHALALRGINVLGVDVVPEAVRRTRSRGVAALHRDVFSALPGEGRWGCVLLADGNIGIGGNPVELLRRAAALLAPGGRVVADLAPPGAGLVTRVVRLECSDLHSETFRWAVVGADLVKDLARAAGLRLHQLHEHRGRWFAVLTKDRR